MKKQIIVLVGPSGSGKTSVAQELGKMGIPQVITHTTRKIRSGEIPNVTYYYVSPEDFDSLSLIEKPNLYAGNLYGMSKMEVESKLSTNKPLVVVPDINGLRALKELYPEKVVSIYLAITEEQMEKRMRARGDSEENIRVRMNYSFDKEELEQQTECDYVVNNDILEETIDKIVNIIQREEENDMNAPTIEAVAQKTAKEIKEALLSQIGATYMQTEEGALEDLKESNISISVKDMTTLLSELDRLEKMERDMKCFADSLVNL